MAVSVAANQPEYGGYEYEFAEEVSEKYICSTICTKVLRDPHLTACCGQHFCESCLEHWFRKQGRQVCPHCREENFNHFLDKSVKREINQLNIYCTNCKAGCVWVDKLSLLKTHLESEKGCQYVEVDCTNKCKKQLLRKDLADHLTHHCPLRKYNCQYCGEEDTYQTITEEHYDTCPNYPLDCPNECGTRGIRRAKMGQHRSKCRKEQVKCINCNKLRMRKDLANHLSYHCPLRKYECQYCKKDGTYQYITKKHYDECPVFPLNCPNDCGARGIERFKMGQHRLNCPQEVVTCPFQEAGCQVKLVRREIETHIAASTQQHLLLIMTQTAKLKEKTEAEFSHYKEKIEAELHIIKRGVSKVVDHLLQSCNQSQVTPLQSIKTLLSGSHLRLQSIGEQITFTIHDVYKYKRDDQVWRSPPFYYKEGYKMRLDISLNANVANPLIGAMTASSSLHLLKGELDDELHWPINHTDTVVIVFIKWHARIAFTDTPNLEPVQSESETTEIGSCTCKAFNVFSQDSFKVTITLKH